MGPLYGTFFLDMAATLGDAETLDAALFSRMLRAGLAGREDLGGAQVGDKTLLDTLVPAMDAFDAAVAGGAGFAAGAGRDERGGGDAGGIRPMDLVAKIGRAARLGERSRGVLDAGAASCCLILQTFATGLQGRMV